MSLRKLVVTKGRTIVRRTSQTSGKLQSGNEKLSKLRAELDEVMERSSASVAWASAKSLKSTIVGVILDISKRDKASATTLAEP